jgi:hypothetical protein
MKEKIKIIKDNISFSELPHIVQENLIHSLGLDLLSRNESERDKTLHHTNESATAMARLHYTEWTDYKYVYYKSSFRGDCVDEIGKEGWR